jgi:hypothetical protein
MAATRPLSDRSGEALRRAELLAACSEAEELLEVGLQRLLEQEVEAPLRPLPGKVAPLLAKELRWRAREGAGLPPRRLARELQGWTEQRLRTLFEAMAAGTEEIVAEGVLDLEHGHAARLERLLADLDPDGTLPADVLRRCLRGVPLRAPSPIGLDLGDTERLSRRLFSDLAIATPGTLGRRLVGRAADARLQAMVADGAARLRQELGRQAAEAVLGYGGEMRAALEEVLAR